MSGRGRTAGRLAGADHRSLRRLGREQLQGQHRLSARSLLALLEECNPDVSNDRAAHHPGLAQRGAFRGQLSQVLGPAAARGDQDCDACGPVGPFKPSLPRAQTERVRRRLRGSGVDHSQANAAWLQAMYGTDPKAIGCMQRSRKKASSAAARTVTEPWLPDGPCWLSTGSCSCTLSARSLLALLEECNPDASNHRATYAPPPGCPAIIASTIGCSTAVSAAVGPERPTTTSSHPVRKTTAVVPKDRSPKRLSDKPAAHHRRPSATPPAPPPWSA